jgi:hypothetical protein
MKIRQWEQGGRTDGQAGIINVIVTFGNFAKTRDKTGV